ncbi:MAG: response regulator transcription factor [Candidatus Dormibacteraceae bacterium]
MAARIRVMLVDDHEVVREGLRLVLQRASDLVVVAEAGTAREAVAEAVRVRPDVVVMDVRLADGSGTVATREIGTRLPTVKVLMLTTFDDEEALFASIMAGAHGYVLKRINSSELLEAIRAVAAGQSLLDPAVTAQVLARLRENPSLGHDGKLARLTPREEQVLSLIAEGRTNGEIAARIHLSSKTVKNHVSNILGKLEVARRAEAAAYLTRHTLPF